MRPEVAAVLGLNENPEDDLPPANRYQCPLCGRWVPVFSLVGKWWAQREICYRCYNRDLRAVAAENDSTRKPIIRETGDIPDEVRAQRRSAGAASRAAKIRATPAWVNRQDVEPIYEQAIIQTRETGIQHHVDHIVPLRGRNVCGLHVSWNLQVIPATENFSKSNRFDEAENG